MDVRSYRGANADSDHFLVLAKLYCRISRYFVPKQLRTKKRYAIERLKDPDVKNKYVLALSAGMAKNGNAQSEQKSWRFCKEVMSKAAEETIEEKEKRTNKHWYDEECSKITDEKNKAYKEAINKRTRSAIEKYKQLRKVEKKKT